MVYVNTDQKIVLFVSSVSNYLIKYSFPLLVDFNRSPWAKVNFFASIFAKISTLGGFNITSTSSPALNHDMSSNFLRNSVVLHIFKTLNINDATVPDGIHAI